MVCAIETSYMDRKRSVGHLERGQISTSLFGDEYISYEFEWHDMTY